jgi:hypothetical protein
VSRRIDKQHYNRKHDESHSAYLGSQLKLALYRLSLVLSEEGFRAARDSAKALRIARLEQNGGNDNESGNNHEDIADYVQNVHENSLP